MSKKHYPFLAEYIFSLSETKEMESYNMKLKVSQTWLKTLLFVQRNKHQSLIFFTSLIVFYNMFMLHWSSRVKSVFILNIAYFLNLFVRKCLHILIKQRKTKKLKTENFDQKSEKRTSPNSKQFLPDP